MTPPEAQFSLPAPDARLRSLARATIRASARGKSRRELLRLIRDTYAALGAATPQLTFEVALTESSQHRLGVLRLLGVQALALARFRASLRTPDPGWLRLRANTVRLPKDASDRWVTLAGFPNLEDWAAQVGQEAPHRFGSIIFLRAWAQREHDFGHEHDRWTVRIGQEVMGHIPIAGPALLSDKQTGQPLEVPARLLPASPNGPALLEVKLPAEAPLVPESQEEAATDPATEFDRRIG